MTELYCGDLNLWEMELQEQEGDYHNIAWVVYFHVGQVARDMIQTKGPLDFYVMAERTMR